MLYCEGFYLCLSESKFEQGHPLEARHDLWTHLLSQHKLRGIHVPYSQSEVEWLEASQVLTVYITTLMYLYLLAVKVSHLAVALLQSAVPFVKIWHVTL